MRLVFKVLFFFFAVYSAFIVYVIIKSPGNSMSSIKSCFFDSDCAETKASCCSCSEGGENTCVNIEKLALWEADLASRCSSIACAQVYNCVSSECKCINSTCVLKTFNSEIS